MTTRTKFDLELFSRILKKLHPRKLHYTFPPEKLPRLLLLKKVQLFPDRKMILLLAVDNLLPPLRHFC